MRGACIPGKPAMAFAFVPSDPLALTGLILILAGIPVVLVARVSKSYGFALLAVLVFGLEMFGRLFRGAPEGLPSGDTVTLLLGMQPSLVVAGGSWWSPITMMFVHADVLHLVGNLFILLTAGPALEDRIGEKAFVIVFFAAGLGSSLVGILLGVFTPEIVNPHILMVGASGAIFGVLTAVAVLYPKLKLPFFTGLFFVFWWPSFVILLVYLAINVIYMFTITGVAWYGHFAGFIVGLIAAPRLPRRGAPLRGRVDVDKLEPLARERTETDILERLRAIGGETADDAAFQEAWLDRFFNHAACPNCGKSFTRTGFKAVCQSGDYEVNFSPAKIRAD